MVSHSKNTGKKHSLRNIIFDKRVVSRQELVELSGLNYRSIIRYTAELKQQKLIMEEDKKIGRGYPGIIYRSNSSNICFVGISLVMNELWFSAIDIDSKILYTRSHSLTSVTSFDEFCKCAISGMSTLFNNLPGRILYSIGFNECLYLLSQERLSYFRKLSFLFAKKYGVPVELCDNDTAILRKTIQFHGLNGRIGAFIPGDKIRFTLVNESECDPFGEVYLRKLRHYKIDGDATGKCSCGKTGCVCKVLTYEGIFNRYKQLQQTEINPLISQQTFLNNLVVQCQSGDPVAVELHREIGLLMANCLIRIQKELHLDHLFLFPPNRTFFDYTSMAYEELTGSEMSPFYYIQGGMSDSILAPAEMMRSKLFVLSSKNNLSHE